MVNKMISIFKPKKIKDFNPSGLNIYTFNAGFKKKDKDLLLIIFNKIVNVCCVYSKTSTPSAPIIWDKKNNKGKVKALVVNAGNANAHTGKDGLKIIDMYVKALTKKIKCKSNEVLVSSTGVIGEKFNPNFHEALSVQEDQKKDPDEILEVIQKGYSIEDRVIRPALVVVNKI